MARGKSNAAAQAAAAADVGHGVRLIEPAKVHGKRQEPGTTVTGDDALCKQLVASGAAVWAGASDAEAAGD